MKIRILYLPCILMLVSMISCKKKDYRMNGTYMPYIYEKQEYTMPPEGYEPFYINYVGRHGSRYPVSDADLKLINGIFSKADKEGALSERGKELALKTERLEKDFKGKWGDLSPLGEEQLRGIAERLINNYPDLFKENIYVQSDEAERCQKSMQSFMDVIKKHVNDDQVITDILYENNPVLNFFRVNLAYLKYKDEGIWKGLYKQFADSVYNDVHPIKRLFAEDYGDSLVQRNEFLHALYTLYAILPDTDVSLSLNEYFTGEELFSLWTVENVRQYLEKGPSPVSKGLSVDISFPLLEDFLATSINAISEGETCADFRFAHAETIIPFAAMLDIEKAKAQVNDLNKVSLQWLDFQISPMAANIMWIFYSNDTGHYLVKMLLNEKEVNFPLKSVYAPYYDWDDVRNYYQDKLNRLQVIPSFSTERQVKYYNVPQ